MSRILFIFSFLEVLLSVIKMTSRISKYFILLSFHLSGFWRCVSFIQIPGTVVMTWLTKRNQDDFSNFEIFSVVSLEKMSILILAIMSQIANINLNSINDIYKYVLLMCSKRQRVWTTFDRAVPWYLTVVIAASLSNAKTLFVWFNFILVFISFFQCPLSSHR